MFLNHRQLSAFLAISRSGSISTASQVLGVTQPALSRSLARLELQVGARLFARRSGGMELTPFGTVLRRHAEMVEFESGRVVEEIRTLSGKAAASVRVGLVPSVAGDSFLSALAEVSERLARVHVVEGLSDQLVEAVTRGEVDFAIVGRLQGATERDLAATPLGSEEVCVAAASSHPIFAVDEPSMADLCRFPWALTEKGNAIWYGFNEMFRQAELAPPVPAVFTNSVHTLKALVARHGYLTMLTRVVFATEEAYGLIRPVPIPGASWRSDLVAIRRLKGQLPAAALMILRELERQASLPTPSRTSAATPTADAA